jgi:hypothetical protein
MLKLNGSAFYRVAMWFEDIDTKNQHIVKTQPNDEGWKAIVEDDVAESILHSVEMLRAELIVLGARLSLMTADRFIDSIKEKRRTYQLVKDYVTSLNQRLVDQP